MSKCSWFSGWVSASLCIQVALECKDECFRDLSSLQLLMSLYILIGTQKLILGFDNEALLDDYEKEV